MLAGADGMSALSRKRRGQLVEALRTANALEGADGDGGGAGGGGISARHTGTAHRAARRHDRIARALAVFPELGAVGEGPPTEEGPANKARQA